MRLVESAVAAVCTLAALAVHAEEGCSKDLDCKSDRICVEKQCVDPPERTATSALPASYQPSPPPPPDSGRPAPATTPAPTPPNALSDSTSHRHLGGFIRPDLGFGYLSTSASSGGMDANISGAAGTFGIAAGGAVSEGVILAFHFWDVVAANPTVTVNNSSASNANATLTVIGLGPELSLYSNENVYFSLTPSLTRATLAFQGTDSNTNWGFGTRAAVGKEWWVSDHWGLGLAAHFSLSINQDSGSNPPTWTGWGATLAFSATYN
jgi:hypothetical protein